MVFNTGIHSETKIIKKDIQEFEKFGWKVIGTNRVGHARHHHTEFTICRDTNMPNYDKIVSLEKDYFSLKG